MAKISQQAAHQYFSEHHGGYSLLDVRHAHEYSISHINFERHLSFAVAPYML